MAIDPSDIAWATAEYAILSLAAAKDGGVGVGVETEVRGGVETEVGGGVETEVGGGVETGGEVPIGEIEVSRVAI